MTMLSIALAALLAVGAQNSPAMDKTRDVAAPATEPGGSGPAEVAPKRYCVVDTPTGSHLPRKECHTRKEWLDQGFDPLAKN